MRINESMKVIDMLRERREHLRNEGEAGLQAAEDWCAYSAEDALSADTIVLIAEPVDVDEETWEEILPQRAEEMGMSVAATAETVDDVVINAVNQNGAVKAGTLVEALNYYLEHDDFMTVSAG